MLKNLFCKDFDYLTGRRMKRHDYQQKSSHNSNRQTRKHNCHCDRPKYLPKLSRKKPELNHGLRDYTKVLQNKCFENHKKCRFTFTNRPIHSRLTLEPELEILGGSRLKRNNDVSNIKGHLGIFANARFACNSNKSKYQSYQNSKIPKDNFRWNNADSKNTLIEIKNLDKHNQLERNSEQPHDVPKLPTTTIEPVLETTNHSLSPEEEIQVIEYENMESLFDFQKSQHDNLFVSMPTPATNNNNQNLEISNYLKQPSCSVDDEVGERFEFHPINDLFESSLMLNFDYDDHKHDNKTSEKHFKGLINSKDSILNWCPHKLDAFPEDWYKNNHRKYHLDEYEDQIYFNDPLKSNFQKLKQYFHSKL